MQQSNINDIKLDGINKTANTESTTTLNTMVQIK